MGLRAVLRWRLTAPIVGLALSLVAGLGAAWVAWFVTRLLRQHWLIDAQAAGSAWLIVMGGSPWPFGG